MSQSPSVSVLLADSHEHYRRGLVRAISSHPDLELSCITVVGKQALAQIRAARPDVALIDVRLPRLDGFAICERMRDTDPGSPTRLILLIAVPDQTQVERGLAVGASGWLSKEFSRTDICDALLAAANGDLSALKSRPVGVGPHAPSRATTLG
jgi:two-component system nitrate/nitrite response regulator NarL